VPAFENQSAAAAVSAARKECPQCEAPVPADSRWRPFCSERCKMSDLGAWFSGRYAIPADSPPDTPEEEPEKN
jgi:endogenous inhibitor of DNA gyrase (YacG/DUF329 family)